MVNDAKKVSRRPWSTRTWASRERRTDVRNECVSRKEPEQTISGVEPFGGMFSQLVRNPKPKEDPHARNCEGCDVARSNGEHQGPRKAQRHKEIEDLHPGQGEERDAKKAKEEIVKNVTESMHECN